MTLQSRMETAPFNAVNRGVYISDNLPFLRSLNDECVDLVCIDPPFDKNETFVGNSKKRRLTPADLDNESRLLEHWGIKSESDASRAGIVLPASGYIDIWSWEKDVHEEWVDELETNYTGVSRVIDAARFVHGESIAAYLCYMAIRLIEMHRVLKPTGSLWLHCDPTANAYLRQLLDGIFGRDNIRNEVVWHYSKWSNDSRQFQQNHDTLFFYSKSDCWTFNPEYFMSEDKKRKLSTGYSVNRPGGVKQLIVYDREAAKHKIAEGDYDKLVFKDDANPGVVMHDVWSDINILNSQDQERQGYPTQKPHKLAERIIKVSTNPGDVVVDCFAGCAYTAVAAEKTGRSWVACDINPRAWTIFKRQFNNQKLGLSLRCNDDTTGQQVIGSEPVVTVHGPYELPQRADPKSDADPPVLQLPERKFKVPASIIPETVMLKELLQLSGYKAWCCGFANRKPDGSIIETARNFHLDHIDPKSKKGSNQIPNRAPLCPHHNIRKGNKRIHLEEYREVIAHAGEMMVDRVGELIDLAWAYDEALKIHSAADRKRNS